MSKGRKSKEKLIPNAKVSNVDIFTFDCVNESIHSGNTLTKPEPLKRQKHMYILIIICTYK